MSETIEKMNLKDYFKSLRNEPRKFIKEIAANCGVSNSLAEKWVYGTRVPGKLEKEVIAHITGIPVSDLFPEE